MPDPTPRAAPEGGGRVFRRHKFLSYQGYAFPWYATVLWILFFTGGILYLVKYILLQ
jgi:hypothetical protein